MTSTIQDLQRLSENSAAYLNFDLVGLLPTTPLNVKATGERMLIRVQWAEASDVDGYRVAVMTNQNLANPDIGLFTVEGAKQREFVYNTGNNALTRFFAVQSFLGGAFSEFSPVVSSISTRTSNNDSGAVTTASQTTLNATETVTRTLAFPGNTIGVNDGVLLTVWASIVMNGATNVTVRLRFGGLTGVVLFSQIYTADGSFRPGMTHLFNRNATNSQIFCVGDTGAPTAASQDTAVAQDFVITGQVNVGTDTAVLTTHLMDSLLVRGASSSGDTVPPTPPSSPPGSGEPPEYSPRGTI